MCLCRKNSLYKYARHRLYILHKKLNQKGSELNVKYKTIKLLDDSIWENLHKLGFGDNFLDATPKTQSMKEKTDKVDCMTINFCPAKDTVKGMRRQFTD